MTNDNLKVNLSAGESNLNVNTQYGSDDTQNAPSSYAIKIIEHLRESLFNCRQTDVEFEGPGCDLVTAAEGALLFLADIEAELFSLRNKLDLSLKENENLRAIIRKELSENDEFGAEYVHVSILRQENASLREMVMQLTLKNDELLAAGVSEWHSTKKQD